MFKKLLFLSLIISLLLPSLPVFAQSEFNPNFILSDAELQSANNWTRNDVQKFLDSKGSYLSRYEAVDVSGTPKLAADIIYDAAQTYSINPKYILVTLQKEQSLITDDSPSQRQLDWAAGYGVCDSCSTDDPRLEKYKGFGAQVDNTAGIMRWYYTNSANRGSIKKKDVPTIIDNQEIIPQSWATAFLYTYTPHLHGNKNFSRIWNTWFTQSYPDGTLLQGASSTETYLIQEGKKRRFANKQALLSRADPKMVITVPEIELDNYPTGVEINFPNYSILHTPSQTYLLDYDTLRPFESEQTVAKLGFNPQEIIDVTPADIANYTVGTTITATSTAPQGVIYQITDLNNTYFILKDNSLSPILDKRILDINFKNIPIEKHTRKELNSYQIVSKPVQFKDGTLLKAKDNTITFVIEKGLKRRIADQDTFKALGYKDANIVITDERTIIDIPEGEPLFLNSNLLSSQNKFLGDSEAEVKDLFSSQLPSYLVAEFPSGRILSGKNVDSQRSIASLTKLLTTYEALNQNFKTESFTTYDSKKYTASGNSLNLKPGEKIKNGDVLTATLVGSFNNTARMIAQNSGLTESAFIAQINKRLTVWGADNTHISDVSGLDEKNQSTPRDLLKIFTKVISNNSIKSTLSKPSFTFKSTLQKKTVTHTVKNTNQLLSITDDTYKIIASKTGYTEEAGSVLIMLVESKLNKKQYVIITMGNPDYQNRFDEPSKIAEWISKNNVTLAQKN